MTKEQELKMNTYYSELVKIGTITTLSEANVFKLSYEKAFSLHVVNYSLPTKEELSSLIKEIIEIDTHNKMTENYLTAEKAGQLLSDAMKRLPKYVR